MLVYYGYTVSPNQVETGEGFLICRNVPIARTGSQKYLGREINLLPLFHPLEALYQILLQPSILPP